jgi:methylated-DNA-[protein]-cysteine S-methyltransferase
LGERSVFDILLLMVGTSFQNSIWNALEKVRFSEIATYLDLALSIGNENAVRAVGNANSPLSSYYR